MNIGPKPVCVELALMRRLEAGASRGNATAIGNRRFLHTEHQKSPVARQVARRPRPACSIDELDTPRVTAAG